jgi:hypothetical protein
MRVSRTLKIDFVKKGFVAFVPLVSETERMKECPTTTWSKAVFRKQSLMLPDFPNPHVSAVHSCSARRWEIWGTALSLVT